MRMHETEKTNLSQCLSICGHHCEPQKVELSNTEERRVRIQKIASGLRKAQRQINKIHGLAERTGNIELLHLLNEQFEFGAEVP